MSPSAPNHPVPFDQSSDVYHRLVAAIAKGAVLFVGAGSSCRVGYPHWAALLKRLSEAAKTVNAGRMEQIDGMEGVDDLLQASHYRKAMAEAKYKSELRYAYGPRSPSHDLFHEALVKLPFRHVLTTNYDGVLQSAHVSVYDRPADTFDVDEWPKLSEFRERQAGADYSRRYVHVHGSIGRPEGIVLCQEDYDARYIHGTRAQAFLREMLTVQRVVFVGFSLTDLDLNYILRQVAGSLGLSEPRHFALLPRPSSLDKERIQLQNIKGKYRIEPVYFDNTANDFSSLATLVTALAEDVRAQQADQTTRSGYRTSRKERLFRPRMEKGVGSLRAASCERSLPTRALGG